MDKAVEALALIILGGIAYFTLTYLDATDAATVVGSIAGMIGGYLTRGIVEKTK